SGERRTGDAPFWEWSEPEDEARIEYEVDDVRHPEQAHGNNGGAGSPEDGVVEEKKHDRAAAAKCKAGVAPSHGDDLWRCAHQAKQLRGKDRARHADQYGDREANGDGLNSGHGGALRIFFANATRHHRGGRKAEAKPNRENEAKQRLGKADGG